MRVFDFFDKMKLFNRLVECEKTGSPSEFATRLNISRTALYEIIDELRSKNIDIAYSRSKQTFYYQTPVSLEVKFTITYLEPLNEAEMKKVAGGSRIIHSVLFSGRKNPIFALNETNFFLSNLNLENYE